MAEVQLECPACHHTAFSATEDHNGERKVSCDGCDARWSLEQLRSDELAITGVCRRVHRDGYDVYDIEFSNGHTMLCCQNTNGAVDHLDEDEIDVSFNSSPGVTPIEDTMRSMADEFIREAGPHFTE